MFGSFIGNVAGISYFLAFQILGILLALYLFQKEKNCYFLDKLKKPPANICPGCN